MGYLYPFLQAEVEVVVFQKIDLQQTDGRTDTTDRNTFLASAAGITNENSAAISPALLRQTPAPSGTILVSAGVERPRRWQSPRTDAASTCSETKDLVSRSYLQCLPDRSSPAPVASAEAWRTCDSRLVLRCERERNPGTSARVLPYTWPRSDPCTHERISPSTPSASYTRGTGHLHTATSQRRRQRGKGEASPPISGRPKIM